MIPFSSDPYCESKHHCMQSLGGGATLQVSRYCLLTLHDRTTNAYWKISLFCCLQLIVTTNKSNIAAVIAYWKSNKYLLFATDWSMKLLVRSKLLLSFIFVGQKSSICHTMMVQPSLQCNNYTPVNILITAIFVVFFFTREKILRWDR